MSEWKCKKQILQCEGSVVNMGVYKDMWVASCDDCKLSSNICVTEKEAIDEWEILPQPPISEDI